MTAQKSIRLITLADQSPAAGFGAAHRRDAGREIRPARRNAGISGVSVTRQSAVKKTAAAGKRAAMKPAVRKTAAMNRGKAGRTAAARGARAERIMENVFPIRKGEKH